MRLEKAAQATERIVDRACNAASSGGQVLVALMMLLVTADVVLRYIFNRPIKGSYELCEFLLVLVAFCGLAYAQMKKSHIKIELVTSRLSPGTLALVNSVTYLLGLGGLLVITWRSVIQAELWRATGEHSGMLDLPIFPFMWVVVLGSVLISLAFLVDFLHSLVGVFRNCRKPWLRLALAGVIVLLLAAFPWWFHWLPWEIDRVIVGLIGILLMIILLFTAMPIGVIMLVIGFLGLSYLINPGAGLHSMGISPYIATSNYVLSTVPLFVLMGLFCFYAELSTDIYGTFHKWMGQLPGGLAMATSGACAAFGAVCGSGQVTAMTMATVALPEMRKYGYDDGLATGSVAAGGMLAILIPPSVPFIVYGLLTEQSVGKLFIAGIFPGMLLAVLMMITVFILVRRNRSFAPPGPVTTFREKLGSLRGTWGILLLFLLVMGSIYAGVCTPTEAAGFGAFGALMIGLSKRKLLNRKNLLTAMADTVMYSGMVFLLMIGVQLFNQFVTVSQVSWALADIVMSLPVPHIGIILAIILFYIAIGFILPVMPVIVLTIPIFFPVIQTMGFDLIWFGVIIMMMVEMAAITPPVALNCFIIAGVAKDVPLTTIYRGVIPFVIASLVCVTLLIAFPDISLFLPRMMTG